MTLEERLATFLGAKPSIHPSAYVSPHAVVLGDVRIGPRASIWPFTVLRGDINSIEVGEGSNIQDGAIIHVSDDHPTVLGKYVTVGHRAIVHACRVEDEALVGMGATVLDGAVIGKGSLIGAHALVTQKQIIPPGVMVMGSPAKVTRHLRPEEKLKTVYWAHKYVEVAVAHAKKMKDNS